MTLNKIFYSDQISKFVQNNKIFDNSLFKRLDIEITTNRIFS
jgi:hypothetical protein